MNDHPFWSFSLERYGREGVASLCLLLQDRHEADVNLLLFALWLGSERLVLKDAGAAALAADAVRAWHGEVVRPLRRVRRWLKGREGVDGKARDALRAAIQKAEIDAEKMEQDMLHALYRAKGEAVATPSTADAPSCMRANAAFFCKAAADGTPAAKPLAELVELCR